MLNKIDTMWDELKNQGQIEAEINKQVQSCASMLNVSDNQVFPVSAQKALVAKINGDASLLERSRLPELEVSLSRDLVQGKQDVAEDVKDSVEDYLAAAGLVGVALLLTWRLKKRPPTQTPEAVESSSKIT